MKTFEVPIIYRSPLIAAIKTRRKEADRMKKDFTPTLLDFGPVHVYMARHFGFCYGVENAIEIAFRTIDANPGKRIFLLSEMIHNPQVNTDLTSRGVRFLQDTSGNQLIPFETLNPDDIVIIPAFGTTLDIEKRLQDAGIKTEQYNTTCPFVEKVWNRSAQIASGAYTTVIHGKPGHEETRATFSHAAAGGPAIVIKDLAETQLLALYIKGEKQKDEFYKDFKGQISEGFNPDSDLQRVGVVNQTTMLASETQEISEFIKQVMTERFIVAEGNTEERFADTRDTLCYATNDNQSAVRAMLNVRADFALVVGGYNSSNTSHLVELCEGHLPVFFISSEENLLSANSIRHYDIHSKIEKVISNISAGARPLKILVTSGASCPDAIVESVIARYTGFFEGALGMDEMTARQINPAAASK